MTRITFFVSLLIAVAMLASCNEFQHKHFVNLDLASRDHAIEKGWVPEFIPSDAVDIDYSGDLDAASVHGSYVSGNTDLLRKHCSNTDDSFRVTEYGPKWLNNDLNKVSTAGSLRLKGYEVLSCDEGGFSVVVSEARRSVYYWSVRN